VKGDTVTEDAAIGMGMTATEKGIWKCEWEIYQYAGDPDPALLGFIHPRDIPNLVDVNSGVGNILVTAGINAMLTALTGGGITAFSNANARIGVGDSATAAAIGDTDLNAATNKLRKAMDATYPTVATNVATFQSTFTTAEANWVWNEWGVFNAGPTGGTMLNHAVANYGTKTSALAWTFRATVTIT
jgi:hypothetical protein